MVESSVENVKNSDDSSAKQPRTGYGGVDAAKDDEPAHQLGLGHSKIEDFAIEAPYSDSEDEQDFNKLDIDIQALGQKTSR